MKRQYLNAFCGVAFVLLGTMVAQAYDFEVDGIYYNILSLDDMTFEVTYKSNTSGKYISPYSGSIQIPSTVAGYTVTAIGDYAFDGCENLLEVTIPETVTSMGRGVFTDSGVQTCIIENGSEPIDMALTHRSPGSATAEGSFFNSNIKYLYLGRKFKFFPEHESGSPFYDMEHLEELVIFELPIPHQNMIAMYDYDNDTYEALPNFKKLTILPGGKLSIEWDGNYQYQGLDVDDLVDFHNIEELSLEGTLSSSIYEYNSFYRPTAYSIRSAFPQIKHLKLNETVSQVGSYKFNRCATETIEINSHTLAIGEDAFLDNSKLTAIVCRTETPSTFDADPGFSNQQYTNLPVYVPENALATYQATSIWKDFKKLKPLSELPVAAEIKLPASITIGQGDIYEMEATVLPENTFDKAVTWSSSNKLVAYVSNAGIVTGIGVGTAIITATCGDVTATCEVAIKPAPSNIKLNYNSFTLGEGENFQLEATVLPEDAIDKPVIWSSSNNNVAIVLGTGLVIAREKGVARITAKCGDVTATCKVTVEAVAREIELNEYFITLCDRSYSSSRDNEFQLEATVLPEDARDKTVTWSSSNKNIATVSETGFVEGVSAGTATITAKCGKASSTCNVLVKPGVSRIELNEEFITLFVGETFQLRATVYPENAFYKDISWSVQNYTVNGVRYDAATVSETGLVKANKVGHAYIEARCGRGVESCFVTVTDNTGLETLLQDPNAVFAVYNVQGILVQQKCTPDELRHLPKGVYILASETGRYKVTNY